MKLYTNNLISIDGSYVGRIDRDSYHSACKPHKPTKFYTGTLGTPTGFDIPHEITAALYVGGPADWKINPDFISEVKAILSNKEAAA